MPYSGTGFGVGLGWGVGVGDGLAVGDTDGEGSGSPMLPAEVDDSSTFVSGIGVEDAVGNPVGRVPGEPVVVTLGGVFGTGVFVARGDAFGVAVGVGCCVTSAFASVNLPGGEYIEGKNVPESVPDVKSK